MSLKYWEYFLSLESDLEKCTRFIEFHPDNYGVFSIELAKILISASAEFENVAKDLCKLINSNSSPGSIVDIYKIINSEFPRFCDVEIVLSRYKIVFKPFSGWTNDVRPDWWSKGYNKIKHSRDDAFSNANLENAIYSMGGLFVVILYYHQKLSGGIHVSYSRAPRLYDTQSLGGEYEGAAIELSYILPL